MSTGLQNPCRRTGPIGWGGTGRWQLSSVQQKPSVLLIRACGRNALYCTTQMPDGLDAVEREGSLCSPKAGTGPCCWQRPLQPHLRPQYCTGCKRSWPCRSKTKVRFGCGRFMSSALRFPLLLLSTGSSNKLVECNARSIANMQGFSLHFFAASMLP